MLLVPGLRRLLYSPFLAQLVVTRRCNLKCGYCNEYDRTSAPVPTEFVLQRIRKLHDLGTFALELTGGEPLLHPDLPLFVRESRRLGFFKTMLISNAYLMTPEKVEALNAAGLQEVQVSVDGVRPNDVTVKCLQPLRKRLEMIARTARFRVVLSAVIGSSTPDEVMEVIAFAKEKGFRPRALVLHGGDGQSLFRPADLEQYRVARAAIGAHVRESTDYQYRLMRTNEAPFRCRAGSRYLYVDEHGTVSWCSQTRGDWGKPLADYTFRDLREQFHTPKSCHVKCTIGCVRTCSAPDAWRSQ